jgi:hypothetical protein
LGCPDGDGDGVYDEEDLWPDDSKLWSDGDGDGFSDQLNTNVSDDCPIVEGYSTVDRLGCLDSDGDGVSDEGDFYPNDSKRSVEELVSNKWWLVVLIAVLALIPVTWIIVRKTKANTAQKTDALFDQMPLSAVAPIAAPAMVPIITPATVPVVTPVIAPVVGPAIPPEGLPPGWTMEQWNYYGQQWLIDQGRL